MAAGLGAGTVKSTSSFYATLKFPTGFFAKPFFATSTARYVGAVEVCINDGAQRVTGTTAGGLRTSVCRGLKTSGSAPTPITEDVACIPKLPATLTDPCTGAATGDARVALSSFLDYR